MADQKIIKSIKLQLQQGLEEGVVKSNLVVEGYQEADIDDAFNNLDSLESESESESVVELQEEVNKPEVAIEEKKKDELIKPKKEEGINSKQKANPNLPKNFRKKLFGIIALNLVVLFLVGAIWLYYFLF